MTANLKSGFGAARAREHDIMSLLARILCGSRLSGSESTDDLRQIGYAAHLARGRVMDPDHHLQELVKSCRAAISDVEVPDRDYRDPAQASWGAQWHLDATKIKVELKLHVMKFQNTASDQPSLS